MSGVTVATIISRFDRQVAGSDIRLGDVSLANAHPVDDPLIGGIDDLFEIEIR